MVRKRRDEMNFRFYACISILFLESFYFRKLKWTMPNLEGQILHSDAPTLPMNSMQKTLIQRGMLTWIEMNAATKGTTTNTTSSSPTMGLDRKSKQISKRGKKTFQKVSIVKIFLSVIYLFLPHILWLRNIWVREIDWSPVLLFNPW